VHGSDSTESAASELRFFFSEQMPTISVLTESTLCLVKPHIVRDGRLGEVLSAVTAAGFQLAGLRSFLLTEEDIQSFYSIYKGNHYRGKQRQIMTHLASGPSIAVELRAPGSLDAVTAF
jgi:nucleoside-diphosphate kinase